MEEKSYYIEVFNTLTNSKGFVVSAEDGFAIAEHPVMMRFFESYEKARDYVVNNNIASEHSVPSIKEQSDLIADGVITVISVKGWYIMNDDGWKLCYNPLTGRYYFDKKTYGFLLWLHRPTAEKALIKFTKHFHVMPLQLEALEPKI